MTKIFKSLSRVLFAGLLIFSTSCERDLEELELATFPANGLVFGDTFSAGLEFAAFGGSNVTAFQVDEEVTYAGTASMRFEVPDFEDPRGAFVGGAFFVEGGRDLSGFNTMSFWAKASESENIGEIGFGNDFGDNTFVASITNVPVTSNWTKYYIPIPDASKLTQERGMFYLSEGADAEEGRGYTIWVDEVKFENLGTVIPIGSSIFNGETFSVSAETGAIFSAVGFTTFNLPTGVDLQVNTAPAYFEFTSSNPSVASVTPGGQITVLDTGNAVISASLGGVESVGSLTINATGEAVRPQSPAPTPDVPADDVISFFSNAYDDVPVDFYNGFWEGSSTQSEIIQVSGDDIIRYSQLNFVGIQFTSPTVNATSANRIHLDIWTPDAISMGSEFKVLLFDVGPDLSFGTGDDSGHEITLPASELQSNQWISIDLPLTDFPGLTNRNNLAQVVLSGNVSNVFLDNLYLYAGEGGGGGGGDDEPTMAAPTPSQAGANVISLFSDAYNDVPVDTWRTDWSEATFEDVTVAGNATKKYSALNFVGIETVMNQIDATDMTHIRMDVWTPDATEFRVKLVDFGPNGSFDGPNMGDDTEDELVYGSPAQGQWVSYDIPLSDFVGLTGQGNIAQLILGGSPAGASTIFVDNIYFYNADGGGGGDLTEPDAPAPTPGYDAANVISLFSEAYTDVGVDTWRTDWSAATFEDITVMGNATKKYSELDFVGIETVAAGTVDASAMTHFSIDVWSADYTFFAVKLVDFGADGAFGGGDDVEHQVEFNMPAQQEWVTLDIPLSDFTGLTTTEHMAQYILVGQPTGSTTVFVDNVLFHN